MDDRHSVVWPQTQGTDPRYEDMFSQQLSFLSVLVLALWSNLTMSLEPKPMNHILGLAQQETTRQGLRCEATILPLSSILINYHQPKTIYYKPMQSYYSVEVHP